jgi:hypothetical protein
MTTKIELEISDDNESTSYPWWVILRPVWATRKRLSSADVSNAVEGPFFSREEAQVELDSRRYYYGKQAVVWCLSGCNSSQYRIAIDGVEKVAEFKKLLDKTTHVTDRDLHTPLK